ncbi:methionine ABC transporter ATP-binding protein [uncultured Tessaracoccus sp.]|uniref:methionine ABC transporter ATP-binding protein n=1 Tax=uncultured Tessaracoccus sp. TaxID=905023 RepID=UPI0025D383AD|nr:ATP-binding cassette domain-containing protein [uncultured Tessaracoccus sp.]
MITVTDLVKDYRSASRPVRALDGVSLTVPAGAIHGIIGHSGAGKSTLVRCLAMLEPPTSGSIEVGGREMTTATARDLRRARRRIGLVFQQANLFDSRTVAHNVAYPQEIAGVPRAKRLARAHELLRRVGLADAARLYPSELSGGMQQRVGIARALATNPDVLLFDEPTSALDPRTTDEILELITNLRRPDLAVIVITHEMHVVKRICDSVSLLDHGRIIESGPLTDVVATLDGRLSQMLLGIPPHDEVSGTLVDVLSRGARAAEPVVAHTSSLVGAELAIIAGSVEHLAGTTFSHLRIAVPDGADPRRVVQLFKEQGADAALTSELEEVHA